MSAKELNAVQIQGITAGGLLEKIRQVIKEATPPPQPQSAKDRLLTRREVCELLKISTVTTHNWAKAGILKPYRIGNKIRFKESEVLDALQVVERRKTL